MKYYPIEIACIYQFVVALFQAGVLLLGFYFIIGCLARTICSVVTCKGGEFILVL
jgi:hypothetical protein